MNDDVTLHNLRTQIDLIDDELVALLLKRSEIVKKVGALKDSQGEKACHIRPGREAVMLRRMVEQFKGTLFAPEAAAVIWRTIIGASTRIESDLRIAVADEQSYWMSREYFGPFTPVIRHTSPAHVIGDVIDGRAAVGLLPLSEEDRWWRLLPLPESTRPRIFATIPFLNGPARPGLLAFAKVAPEQTGDDTSLLYLESDVSQSRLNAALAKAGFTIAWLDTGQNHEHLIAVPGFFTEESPQWRNLLSEIGASLQNACILGTYANPIPLR